MGQDIVRDGRGRDVCFEVPPRLGPSSERRLAGRAVTRFASGDAGAVFRDNALGLAWAGGALRLTAVGRTVAAGFGLVPGPLAGPPDSLAGVLAAAFAELRASGAVTPFEAAVATPHAACVLLRGVLLPVAGGAEAVLSWKQVLDDDATARLRAELLRDAGAPPVPRGDADAVFA